MFNLVETLGPFPNINPEIGVTNADESTQFFEFGVKKMGHNWFLIDADSSDFICKQLYEDSSKENVIALAKTMSFEHMQAMFYKMMVITRYMFEKLPDHVQQKIAKTDNDPRLEALFYHRYLSVCWNGLNGWLD